MSFHGKKPRVNTLNRQNNLTNPNLKDNSIQDKPIIRTNIIDDLTDPKSIANSNLKQKLKMIRAMLKKHNDKPYLTSTDRGRLFDESVRIENFLLAERARLHKKYHPGRVIGFVGTAAMIPTGIGGAVIGGVVGASLLAEAVSNRKKK
tara:strand:- start:732 stop:1175 length:444 start_codon:yes stop_codon:yes gene_type:complete